MGEGRRGKSRGKGVAAAPSPAWDQWDLRGRVRAGHPLLAPLQAPRPQAFLKVPEASSLWGALLFPSWVPGARLQVPGGGERRGLLFQGSPMASPSAAGSAGRAHGGRAGERASGGILCPGTLPHMALRWDLELDFRGFCSLLASEHAVLGRLYSQRGRVLITSLLTGGLRARRLPAGATREVAVPAANARSPAWGRIPLGPQQLQTGVRQRLPRGCLHNRERR